MELKHIKQRQVENGIAKPVNPFTFQPVSLYSGDVNEENYKWAEFEQFTKQHTYATSAPPGIHSAEMFGEVLEQGLSPSMGWINKYDIDWASWYLMEKRKFLPFKHPVEPNDKQPVEVLAESLCANCGGSVDVVKIGDSVIDIAKHPINPNANAIKIVSDRIELFKTQESSESSAISLISKACLAELNHILKLLQS